MVCVRAPPLPMTCASIGADGISRWEADAILGSESMPASVLSFGRSLDETAKAPGFARRAGRASARGFGVGSSSSASRALRASAKEAGMSTACFLAEFSSAIDPSVARFLVFFLAFELILWSSGPQSSLGSSMGASSGQAPMSPVAVFANFLLDRPPEWPCSDGTRLGVGG